VKALGSVLNGADLSRFSISATVRRFDVFSAGSGEQREGFRAPFDRSRLAAEGALIDEFSAYQGVSAQSMAPIRQDHR
jgi:hypothetical protein